MTRYFIITNKEGKIVYAIEAESENDGRINSLMVEGFTLEEVDVNKFNAALKAHELVRCIEPEPILYHDLPKVEFYDPKAEVKAQKKHEREQMKLRSRYYGKYR